MFVQEPIVKIIHRLGKNLEIRSNNSPTTGAVHIQDDVHRILFYIFSQDKHYPGTAIHLLSVGLIGFDFIVLRGRLGVKKINNLLRTCGEGGSLVLKHIRIMDEFQYLERQSKQ